MTTPTSPRPVWPAVLTVLAAIVSVPLSVVLAFAGLITWSGCFMSCRGANHGEGALLYLGALAALSTGPLLARYLVRSRGMLAATLVLPAVALGYVLIGCVA